MAAINTSREAMCLGLEGKISTDFSLLAELEGKCWELLREEPKAGIKGDALVLTGEGDEVESSITVLSETLVHFAELLAEDCKVETKAEEAESWP
ncbi:hypothetical protein RhiirC2_799624 [Rhizophagus irregularis]|uniref:Uncharacterized protein n=1 Tax=Rhizophagus irregularis TaxID=588596 RepID=A0A2N1M4U7_9GLOM|nr:hypothetical protein RhiirC2_799624 [Rhizophagus irregularis]